MRILVCNNVTIMELIQYAYDYNYTVLRQKAGGFLIDLNVSRLADFRTVVLFLVFFFPGTKYLLLSSLVSVRPSSVSNFVFTVL